MTLGFEELIKSKSYISGLGVRVREDVFFICPQIHHLYRK